MRRAAALLLVALLAASRLYAQCSFFTNGCPAGSGGGGGSGGVSSVDVSVPSWLSASGGPVTSSGTIAITGATGLTTGRVVGTCAGATTLALCPLGIGDVPDLWNHTFPGDGRVEFDGSGGLNMIIDAGDFDIELDGANKTIGLQSYGGNISITASGSTGSNGYIYMGGTAGVRLPEIAPTCGAGMANRFYARSTSHQLCYCSGTTEYCSGDAPALHAASHKNGGADEVATATPAANAIPKADGFGQLAAGWFPTLNQSTTGSAATLTTPRAIYGNNFDGSAALTQIIASTFGGTGNGFTKFSGPATAEKTLTLPNASATILTDNAAVTVAQGGTGTTTLAAHGLVLGNGASTVNVTGTGTAGQVITSNGPSADPTFQAAATLTGLGATDRALVITSGTAGNAAQGSTATYDASGNLAVGGCVKLGGHTSGSFPALIDSGNELAVGDADCGAGIRRLHAYEFTACSERDCAGDSWSFSHGTINIQSAASHDWIINGSGATGHLKVGPTGGLSQADVTTLSLTPASVGTCDSTTKGFLRVSLDGTLCNCNGTTWTASPIAGSCT